MLYLESHPLRGPIFQPKPTHYSRFVTNYNYPEHQLTPICMTCYYVHIH